MRRFLIPGLVLLLSAASARTHFDSKPSKPDPEATKLLADARAARANWRDFPGFSADLEVNINGKVYKTRMVVTPKGEVELKLAGADESANNWARRVLGSLVGHRMDGGRDAELAVRLRRHSDAQSPGPGHCGAR